MIVAQMIRMHRLKGGIFGKLIVLDIPFYTAEHSYPVHPDAGSTIYAPKVVEGEYLCKRYMSPTKGPVFMLQNVPDFQGQPVTEIEIHILNYPQTQSLGCIGLGKTLDIDCASPGDIPMIGMSEAAFREFMLLFDGTDEFKLVIQ